MAVLRGLFRQGNNSLVERFLRHRVDVPDLPHLAHQDNCLVELFREGKRVNDLGDHTTQDAWAIHRGWNGNRFPMPNSRLCRLPDGGSGGMVTHLRLKGGDEVMAESVDHCHELGVTATPTEAHVSNQVVGLNDGHTEHFLTTRAGTLDTKQGYLVTNTYGVGRDPGVENAGTYVTVPAQRANGDIVSVSLGSHLENLPSQGNVPEGNTRIGLVYSCGHNKQYLF